MIQYHIFYPDITSNDLRKMTCDYMENNQDKELANTSIKKWIEFTATSEGYDNIDDYIIAMRKPSQWGGGLELAIISKMLNINIRVVKGGKTVSKFKNSNNPKLKIYLKYTGSHYIHDRMTKITTKE